MTRILRKLFVRLSQMKTKGYAVIGVHVFLRKEKGIPTQKTDNLIPTILLFRS